MTVRQDQELVNAVIAGERDAFSVLVSRYSRLVVAVAAEILHDKHAAEDVAQDAFVTAYEKLESLRNRNAFGPWFLRITRRNACRSAIQRNQLRTNQDANSNLPQQNGHLDDRSKELLILIQRLPEHERVVVMLKYFDEHSVNDIAKFTGQSVSTVTKKLTRARRRLENWLKEQEK